MQKRLAGQMKTLLDRLNPLYSTDYAFRDICMIATAAEDEDSAFEKAYNGLPCCNRKIQMY